jgi:hypothetical protein
MVFREAKECRCRGAELSQVPNQPLTFDEAGIPGAPLVLPGGGVYPKLQK